MATGIGELSSILTLVKAAAVLATSTRELVRRFKRAPADLHALAAQLQILQSELERARQASDDAHEAVLTDEIRGEINNAIGQAQDAVDKLEEIRINAQGNARVASRLRWIAREQAEVTVLLTRIRAARDQLAFLLQILSCRGTSVVLTKIGEMKDMLSHAPAHREGEAIFGPSKPPGILERSNERRKLLWTPWLSGSNLAALGVKCSMIPTEFGSYTDYSLAMQFCFPFRFIAFPYAFLMSISVRNFPLSPGKFSFLEGSNITFTRILSHDDLFMTACRKGEVDIVRNMLRSKERRTSDIVPRIARNWNPLAIAIFGGSVEVVKVLLEYGADVEGTFSELQLTPLQWAVWRKEFEITQLLLEWGASQDHLNTVGWNATFFCWPTLEAGEGDMLRFLNLLDKHAYQDLDVVDTEGWTILHRVAAHATPSEVTRLIELGADPAKEALPLRWNAIHHAVFYGNYPAFSVLLSHYENNAIAMTDERGWTLLHIAASAGHDDIMRRLLELGADPFARSKPFMSHMPESLFGRECTPQEVAGAQSPEREAQYLSALRDVRSRTGYVVDEEVDDDVEMEFWEANEHF